MMSTMLITCIILISQGMMLVSQPLTPDNYNTWSRAMIGALKAKNKLSFVDGTFKKPEKKVTLQQTCTNGIDAIVWLKRG